MSLEDTKKKYDKFINITLPEIWYKTSLLSLNRAMDDQSRGIKGGRFLQIIGWEKVGKSTLSYDIVSNAQKVDHVCAYIDIERTHDPLYAASLGVDTENLITVYPDYTETAMKICEELILSGVKVIVFDSIPAALPKEEKEKDIEDNEKMAVAAGLFSRFIKRMTPILSNHGALLILINQYRANITKGMSRSEKKPYGATFMRYATGLKLDMARIENEDGKSKVQITVEKSKQGREGKKTDVWMNYGQGFDIQDDILSMALEYGIVIMSGKGRYNYGDIKAHGRDNAKENFPMDKIKNEVLERINE